MIHGIDDPRRPDTSSSVQERTNIVIQVTRIEGCHISERVQIEQLDLVTLSVHESLIMQYGECTADVHGTQPQSISQLLL